VNINPIRCGIVGIKLSMSQIFDTKTGSVTPVTILHVEDNVILDVLIKNNLSYSIYKVAAFNVKQKYLNKSVKGQFDKVKISYKKVIKEFKVTNKVDDLSIGDTLEVSRYKIGQHIDVTAVSSGKGFSGGMKRHNFSGLEASHGVSVKHRSIGSTGQCQDPGRVFKGKKMPGQLGNKKTTMQNLRIVDIDKKLDLIIVKGAIPGKPNSIVVIRDSIKKSFCM
jgi:large subunit ribosomal protein L3